MAVIIEQEGEPKYHRVQCTCCKSVLRFLNTDEKEDCEIDGYFGPETIKYVICPKCGDKVVTWAMCDNAYVDNRIK